MSFPLEHSVPTVGFRLEEAARARFLPDKLEEMGIRGAMIGRLQREGWIKNQERIVRLEEVTVPHRGSIFAFVMDTRSCQGAMELAKDADLLVMEATYTSEHQDLASVYFHSTAANAAKTALDAGAKLLALGHFSQRYLNAEQHLIDAREIFPNVVALNDLDRIEITHRRQPSD